MGGWWRWALLSLDGVAPSRMVSLSAFVNLPLHHKLPKRALKRLWCGVVWYRYVVRNIHTKFHLSRPTSFRVMLWTNRHVNTANLAEVNIRLLLT